VKKGEHIGREDTSGRGLYDYAKIVDGYGTEITVRQSSAAWPPHVWVFSQRNGEDGKFHLGRWVGHQPHLGVREAKLLRDALDRFIERSGT
jgi:hypothetical protein